MTPEMAAPAGGAATWVFWAAATFAVVSALATVLFRGPIRSAVALLGAIGSLAVLFVLLDAHLLAAIQVIVYAGAVVVLFVFVIMVLGPASEPPGPGGGSLFARGLSILVLGWFGWRLFAALYRTHRAATIPEGFGTVEKLADELFGPYLFQFELVSILLLVAVVGAIAVAKGKLRARTRS
jgi:NADH-quinone oxidoreductase subunit J